MAQLAIKGHATRGSEVIELLEMLGGKNIYNLTGTKEIWYILSNGTIEHSAYLYDELGFSLEEFLEKFPYKIGDKVNSKYLKNHRIEKMGWKDTHNRVTYKLQGVGWFAADELEPYKKETMEEQNEKSVNHVYVSEVISFDIAPKDKYELDLQGKFEVTLHDGKYFVERIKPQYPKTYEECCEILMGKTNFQDFSLVLTKLSTNINEENSISLEPPHIDTINSLYKLLICRDAYWKIAGEQMGLGKPWKPDWNNDSQFKYIIACRRDKISKDTYTAKNCILTFPIEEMRDIFFKNFKILIELCKELL